MAIADTLKVLLNEHSLENGLWNSMAFVIDTLKDKADKLHEHVQIRP